MIKVSETGQEYIDESDDELIDRIVEMLESEKNPQRRNLQVKASETDGGQK